MIEISNTLYVSNRKDWRAWLRKNHQKKKEIWLVYFKKHTGKPRIQYSDAVEEALCYGWIDSTVKRIDDEKYAQKFTPRRIGSKWSKLNIQRVKKMIKQKKMTKKGLSLFNKGRSLKKTKENNVQRRLVMPAALKDALSKNKKARDNFTKFAKGYKRTYIMYISTAKKSETRARRIKKIVELAEKNIKSAML